MDIHRITLPGAERAAVTGATILGPVDPTERIEITLVLRRRAEPPASAFSGAPLGRDDLAAAYGAAPEDLALVQGAVTAAGAEVISSDRASRRVRVAGTAQVLSELFGTALESATAAGSTESFRHRVGGLSIPAELDGVVVAVLGLDNRPQARSQFRLAVPRAGSVSYTPLQLAEVYGLPAADGSGQTLAIIELGGGYQPTDLETYFAGLGVSAPTVTSVGVDGGANGGGADPSGADGEVLLDIEVAGALVPAASLVVYFAPNTDAGFLDAVSTAAHADPAPTAISISWGGSEDSWTAQARNAMDQAFADAALLGATVTVAAGDNGSSDGTDDGSPHVDFPASSPNALACGGTSLRVNGTSVASETVWNDGSTGGATGGGVSDAFALPSWQGSAGVPTRSGGGTSGRGVPDVSAVADPQTGYQVLVDGEETVVGGTSAVAPLWAGLICRLAQLTGRRFGLLQPALYAGGSTSVAAGSVAAGFRDITSGNNGDYSAGPGWDACTGLGVPDGSALLALLSSAPSAR
jgi:kumamolisin